MSRIETLIARMTLPEKLGQLTMSSAGFAVTGPVIAADSTQGIKAGTIGSLLNLVGCGPAHELQRLAVQESRLGIPLLIAFDVIHGHRTLFPVPLAEAGAFDPSLWRDTARAAAADAASDGLAMTFAPMLDVTRDPRWGRGVEGPGEDPWLAERIAAAKVAGFQGSSLAAADSLAAVAKHFCGYGAVTGGREYASVDVSERTLREVHMPAFAAAVRAGVAAVMPAFMDLAGIPLTAHRALLHDWLRVRFGFDGVIVSDYDAIGELLRHGVAADVVEAAALALDAGVDIDMMSFAYRRGLPLALESGRVSIGQVDAAVRRVLHLKQRLGLFDDPYRRGAQRQTQAQLAERRALARRAAARSIVLLKNDRAVLPLAAGVRRLALLGPLADAAGEMCGPWAAAGGAAAPVSVLAGFRAVLPQLDLRHAAGVGIDTPDPGAIDAALELCDWADAVLLCVGEPARMSGEAASRADLDLPGLQRPFAEAVFRRAAARGIAVVVVLFSGRPLAVPWLAERADALLAAWFPGSEAGHALADLVGGRVSPSARTAVTWPRALGQVPIHFGERPTGRPANSNDHYTSKYLDLPPGPLFAFGHGLTYGRFRYANLRVAPERLSAHETAEIRVDVTNEGQGAAQETVFLFTGDPVASVARPRLELKGFARIELAPGETGTVTLPLAAEALRFLGPDLEPVLEAGEIEILVGPCADRDRLLAGTLHLGCANSVRPAAPAHDIGA